MTSPRGQSNLSGSVLLILVTVVLSTVAATFFAGFATELTQPAEGDVIIKEKPSGNITVTLEGKKTADKIIIRGSDGTTKTLNTIGETETVSPAADRYSIIGVKKNGEETLIETVNVPDLTPTTPVLTVTITPSPTATSTPTPTPTPTATPTPTPTPTATPTPTPTATPTSGSLLWTSNRIPLESSENGVFASGPDELYTSNGSEKWNGTLAEAAIHGGTAVGHQTGDDFVAYDSATGNKLWTTTASCGTKAVTDFDRTSRYVVSQGGDNCLVYIDTADGTEVFSRTTDNVLMEASETGEGHLYVASEDDVTLAQGVGGYGKTAGLEMWIWTNDSVDGGDNIDKVDAINGNVVATDGSDGVWVLDGSDGSKKWGRLGAYEDEMFLTNSTVYISEERKIIAYNLTNGNEQWSTKVGADVQSYILGTNGVLYTAQGGMIRALDGDTGDKYWVDNSTDAHYVTTLRDGVLYGQDLDGNGFAYDTGTNADEEREFENNENDGSDRDNP